MTAASSHDAPRYTVQSLWLINHSFVKLEARQWNAISPLTEHWY